MKLKKILITLLLVPVPQDFLFSSTKLPASATTFGPSIFFDANYFYLGANTTNRGSSSLARAYLWTDTTACQNEQTSKVALQPLAPKMAYVNSGADADKKLANPIYNADIKDIALRGIYPVVLLGTKNPDSTASPIGTNQTICFVNDENKGTTVFTNVEKLKDANEAETSGITAIASSRGVIFAAVAPNGGPFGGTGSGISLLSPDTCKLANIDATTGKQGNKAVNVITPAGSNITVRDHITMYWDDSLRRLFIGLNIAQNGSPSSTNALLVGRVEGTTQPRLIIESALPNSVMTANTYNYITGFVGSSGTNEVIIHKLRTLHTSTGKTYVIVNGNTYSSSGNIRKTDVFAIPIVHSMYSDKTIPVTDDVGKITNNDNEEQDRVINDETKTTKDSDVAAIVGAGTTPGDVVGMYTLGDVVYVYCTHATDKTKQGIFVSSAIFGTNGLIRGWTKWHRTMGAVDNVYGMGIEATTTRFWYLTQQNNPGDTVKVTSWSVRDETLLGLLRDKLSEGFTHCDAGVHQLFNFSEKTPGFQTDQFSMMVATGYQKVALIRTGKMDSGAFVPTAGDDFGTNLATNLAVFNDQVLQDIGPLCAADVSRSGTEDWLFVGGFGGLAVLSQSSGAGYANLNSLSFPGFSFKKIGSFSRVYKIVCNNKYLYVLTPKALYRIELDANKFKILGPSALNAEIIALCQETSTIPSKLTKDDSLLDFVISSKIGFLSTTAGLYRTANGYNVGDNTVANAKVWTEMVTSSGFSLGPVTHLSTVATGNDSYNGMFPTGGNLYAVAGDMSHEIAAVVRFDVADTSGNPITSTTVLPIAEKREADASPMRNYFYAFGEFRSAFVTNGTFGFHTLSRHFDKTLLARAISMGQSPSLVRSYEKALPLELSSDAYKAGIPVQNTASGAWIIPGDWGIKIHE